MKALVKVLVVFLLVLVCITLVTACLGIALGVLQYDSPTRTLTPHLVDGDFNSWTWAETALRETGGRMATLIGLAILAAVCIPLALIVGSIALGWAAIRRVGGRETRTSEADEARMIQDIYHGLMKMEERVEALETLLMDTQRKGTKS